MFAYAKNMQLALSDKLRRTGLAAGAGVVLMLGAGFLLAALWTYLAYHLGWGSVVASLAIGGALVVIGLICLIMAKRERHRAPTADELKSEVSEQISLMANTAISRASDAADAAFGRANDTANEFLQRAEHKAHSVADDLSYRANRFADHAEAKVYGSARHMGEKTAQTFGISPQLMRMASEKLGNGKGSNAATLAPVLGAFAIGITLASRFQDWRHRDDAAYPEDDDDYYDEDTDFDDWDDPRNDSR